MFEYRFVSVWCPFSPVWRALSLLARWCLQVTRGLAPVRGPLRAGSLPDVSQVPPDNNSEPTRSKVDTLSYFAPRLLSFLFTLRYFMYVVDYVSFSASGCDSSCSILRFLIVIFVEFGPDARDISRCFVTCKKYRRLSSSTDSACFIYPLNRYIE